MQREIKHLASSVVNSAGIIVAFLAFMCRNEDFIALHGAQIKTRGATLSQEMRDRNSGDRARLGATYSFCEWNSRNSTTPDSGPPIVDNYTLIDGTALGHRLAAPQSARCIRTVFRDNKRRPR